MTNKQPIDTILMVTNLWASGTVVGGSTNRTGTVLDFLSAEHPVDDIQGSVGHKTDLNAARALAPPAKQNLLLHVNAPPRITDLHLPHTHSPRSVPLLYHLSVLSFMLESVTTYGQALLGHPVRR